MSLLFNTLSRLAIASFISWLESPSVVILEPKKIKSVKINVYEEDIKIIVNFKF